MLHQTGLTDHKLTPGEYPEVLKSGIGLTDLCKARSGSDLEVGTDAFDVDDLVAKICAHRPRAIAFNGLASARAALGRSLEYGRQTERFAGASAWVLPSTSGAANASWDAQHWHDLAVSVPRDDVLR